MLKLGVLCVLCGKKTREKKMRNNTQIFIGVAILVIGLVSLIGSIFDVDMGNFLCPTALILVGVWLLVRPRLVSPGTAFTTRLLGDVRRRGEWQVADEEIHLGVGDIKLDMASANIPIGETRIRAFGLVNSIILVVPQEVGVAVSSMAFLTEAKIFGQKHSQFFSAFYLASEEYETAQRKVCLDLTYFVADITIKRTTQETA
jgi:predicted membrane protein